MCDLNNAFTFRGVELNSAALATGGTTGGKVLSGCQIDTIEHGQVEIVQFKEKLALADGMDVGCVYLGGRHIYITGTYYGTDRAAAIAGIAAIEVVMLPASGDGTFGYYTFPLTEGSVAVQPQGLRVVWNRNMYGGKSTDPLAIRWSVTMYAKNARA